MKLFFLFLVLPIFLFQSVVGLSLTGSPMPANVFYEAGQTKEFTYRFGTNSHTQDYRIDLYSEAEYDVSKFVTVEPNYFKQVPPGSAAEFKVKLDFFEESITPGRHDVLAIVKETEAKGGAQIGATAQVAVRFRITALYPTEYINWKFSAADANIGEVVNIKTELSNWGVPRINDAVINYKIYDSKNVLIKEVTSKQLSLDSKQTITDITSFDSQGLLPDDYLIRAKLEFAGISETKETKFRLGSKTINILNMTREFSSEAINVVNVIIESGWNDDIEEIKGEVIISNDDEVIETFSLEEASLERWSKIAMKGYFETFDIPNGNYLAKVELEFGDETASNSFDISISEQGKAQIADQLPFGAGLFTMNNFIMLALIIILGMNIWYLIDKRKR